VKLRLAALMKVLCVDILIKSEATACHGEDLLRLLLHAGDLAARCVDEGALREQLDQERQQQAVTVRTKSMSLHLHMRSLVIMQAFVDSVIRSGSSGLSR
jgi:hypothetical protein